MSLHESEPPADMPPPPPAPPVKAPGMVVWALVLSILGFCGITAVIGIVLGFIGRGQAKKVGAGVGMATAAIIIGSAWVALGLIGTVISGLTASTDGASVEEVVEEMEAQEALPEAENEAQTETRTDTAMSADDWAGLGVTVDTLPARWNTAVEEIGVGGLALPDVLDGEQDTLTGLNRAYLQGDDASYASINWKPDTGEVVGIEVGGLSDTEQQASAVAATAAAMIHATTNLSVDDASGFLLSDLVGTSLDAVQPGDMINEMVEQDDRVYRFDAVGNTLSFSVDAQ